MSRITPTFEKLKAQGRKALIPYVMSGFPYADITPDVMHALVAAGSDVIELGIPFSDPMADGPVIQYSNTIAINNGMMLKVLFEQLKDIRKTVHIPLVLMGYINPALQYGMDNFLKDAQMCGIDGVIIPDLPMYEYEAFYKKKFEQYNLQNIFLVTPQTNEERIHKIDALSDAFIYIVSSNAITGGNSDIAASQKQYFQRIKNMSLKNPTVIGFGIKDKTTFDTACEYSNGAIIGSAFVQAIDGSKELKNDIQQFIQSII